MDLRSELSALADAGWAALERVPVGAWEARFASGVTKRANSAWPAAGAGAELTAEVVAELEQLYRARGIVPAFQLSPADAAAERLLIGRGYRVADDTTVMTASVSPALTASPAVGVAAEPSAEWLATWWAVDGRGGPAELEVAQRIMAATPALYGAVSSGGRIVSVARLALVEEWGGLYCVATLPDARREGHSSRVIEALLAFARDECGVTDAWLQVLTSNTGAQALYASRFGFTAAGGYRYLAGALQATPAAYCRA
ncbi:MAG: GNAT family N-acetyltransferase [Microbacteriaceae bacterium]|nr:GNAT family N-acetyltransferase [Nocardioidaceae bacterium]MCL2795769.1 GNAT family N-acetyltransferase [Microbacteriaceae bacterium]